MRIKNTKRASSGPEEQQKKKVVLAEKDGKKVDPNLPRCNLKPWILLENGKIIDRFKTKLGAIHARSLRPVPQVCRLARQTFKLEPITVVN